MNNDRRSNRRYYVLILIGIVSIIMIFWLKTSITPDLSKNIVELKQNITDVKAEVNDTKQLVNVTGQQVNITKDAVQNLTFNQNVSFQNQKTLARGINTLGSVVIPAIKNISNKTNLLDDIKFSVDQVLNKTEIKNVTLSNTSKP